MALPPTQTPPVHPAPAPGPTVPATRAPKRRGWLRENIEALGFAIVLALVLKYFALEAYEIPTSSMQPTLMGSRAAWVFDRILVDKLSYTFREPDRFDVAVFRYPLNQSQNYVKRIWGLPGDALKIVDGNVYRRVAGGEGDARAFEALRKPDRLQGSIWKLVYDTQIDELGMRPLRPESDFQLTTRDLGGGDGAAGRATFQYTRDRRRFTLRSSTKSRGVATLHAGDKLRDHYWHGYPQGIQEAIIKGGEVPPGSGAEPVQDLRVSLRVLPSEGTTSVFLALRMEQEVGGPRIFRLELDPTAGRLVGELDREKPATRAEVASRLTAGREVTLTLTHVDDQVTVSVDGVEGSGRFAYRPAVLGLKKDSAVDLTFGAEGTGEVVFSHLRIDRDVHMRSGGIAENQRTVDVPPGHYWMLGDNTLASEDGRAWTEISFKVNERGDILPPGDPAAHPVLRGNRRPIRTMDPMDPDENPVISTTARKVVFTDWLGEEHTFPWNGKEWSPELPQEAALRPVSFVPREHVIGRALLVFWPLNPLGAFRLGFVK